MMCVGALQALNTFIDDLFAFIIPMPTMHRLACFRDDIVFFLYLYQRWSYHVDTNRLNEHSAEMQQATDPAIDGAAPLQPSEKAALVAQNMATLAAMSQESKALALQAMSPEQRAAVADIMAK